MAVLYKLNKDNRETSKTKGQYFGRAIQVGTIDTDGLAKIMQANCTLKASDIKAVITELVETMATQLQNSMRVHLNGLGSFKIGIRGKGSATVDDYSVAKNVKGLHVNFQPEARKDSAGNRQKALLTGAKVMEAPVNTVIGEKAKAKAATGTGTGA